VTDQSRNNRSLEQSKQQLESRINELESRIEGGGSRDEDLEVVFSRKINDY